MPADGAWRPISSAPKDGTRVLVWDAEVGRDGCGGYVIAFWRVFDAAEHAGRWVSEWGRWVLPEPQHWMPLPPAPGEDTREE